MKLTIVRLAGLRWRIDIDGGGSFHAASWDDALNWLRRYVAAQLREEGVGA
jgi:hypothetical protein